MSKLKYSDIKDDIESHGWKLISDTYINLDTELCVECAEGHRLLLPYKKIRTSYTCPVCKQNSYKLDTISTQVLPKKKNMKRFLALDQATKLTGWSIYDGNELVSYGIYQINGNEEERINAIKYWLISMINNWKPDYIGLEDIFLDQSDFRIGLLTYKTLAHLQGVLKDIIFEAGIDHSLVISSVWRQHCDIKGRTQTDKKKSAQIRVKEMFDISVTEDVAEAICIGKYLSDTFVQIAIMKW